jgi:uncharacterized repeat protein (TIGR03803 family)
MKDINRISIHVGQYNKVFLIAALASAFFSLLLTGISARADVTYTELAIFNGTNGMSPEAALVLGQDGNFYGSTQGSQIYQFPGTIFQMTPSGTLSNLVLLPTTFPYNGDFGPSGLIAGSDGSFYGSMQTSFSNNNSSGFGSVFSMTPTGSYNDILFFNGTNGSSPSGVMQASDGNFYGCTDGGGTGYGTIFGVNTGGTLTSLWSFDGTNGASPLPPLIQAPDGNLYGATLTGGTNADSGTVFKISTNGDFKSLISFGNSFSRPEAGLTLGLDGNFYGITQMGGTNAGGGSIFRINTNGALTTLVIFNTTNAYWPNTRLLQASDGNFYGATQYGGTNGGGGTIFSMTPEGSLNILYSFTGKGHGFGPITEIIQGSDGNLYGASIFGGPYGFGSIFRLSVPGANSTRIFVARQAGGDLVLTWKPLPGRTYQLQCAGDIGSTNWSNYNCPITATNSPLTCTIQPAGDSQRFFRVALLP